VATPSYLRPAQAAKHFPHDGSPPHPSKVTRLIVCGVVSKAHPGCRIRLRAIRGPQGWLTTVPWIEQFVAELTADRLGSPAPNAAVEARAERAMAALSADGW
jgi:hypothetical protein